MQLFFVVLDPVEVAATLGGVVAGRIAVLGADEFDSCMIRTRPLFRILSLTADFQRFC